MSRSLNKVMLIGNVGSDPEVRATASGARVAKLSLATNRSFQDKAGQQQERTDWHRLTFFGKLADIIEQWVHKGDKIYVEGRLEYSQTQDDQGATRYWTDIVVNEMMMLGGQPGGGGGGGGSGGAGEYASGAARGSGASRGGRGGMGGGGSPPPDRPLSEPDDDLPF
jgi:single-strand DNA-binding protein